jgi:hypothetical protein
LAILPARPSVITKLTVGDTAVNRFDRKIRFTGSLLALLLVFVAAPSLAGAQEAAKSDAPAQAQAAEKKGVTFFNRSRDTQNVLAVFSGEKCEEMKERAQVTIEPGQSAAVESGENQVCWCASTLGKVGNCTVWTKAKPGKAVTIR